MNSLLARRGSLVAASVTPLLLISLGANTVSAAPGRSAPPRHGGFTPSRVDVTLESLDMAGKRQESAGENVFNDDERQTLSGVIGATQMQMYAVRIKNVGDDAAAFRVHLDSLLAPKDKDAAWKPKGWTAFATLEGDGNNILDQLLSEEGWTTPNIASRTEVVVRLAITAPDTLNGAALDGSFRVLVEGDQRDSVVGNVQTQGILKLQWYLNGDSDKDSDWHDVTDATVIEIRKDAVFGLRAIKAVPDVDWPDKYMGPMYDWQNYWVNGGTVYLGGRQLTGEDYVTVTAGNTLKAKVRVLPKKATTDDE